MKIKASLLAMAAMAGASFGTATPAAAQAEPFIGQIMYFGGNFCPRGWMRNDGQLLAISSNTALFSILGTTYGGDGRTSFALPDLRGRVAFGPGRGPGLSDYRLGQRGGSETHTLTVSEMPSHSHQAALRAHDVPGTSDNPSGRMLADFPPANTIYAPGPGNVSMHPSSIVVSNAGGNMAFNKMQPFLTLTTCIATVGIYPSRS